MHKKISFRSVPKPGPGHRAGFFIARTRLKSRYAANAAPCHVVGRGRRQRERRQAAGGAHDCARQGAPLRPLLLRFMEALNTPVVGPVMCLFGGRRDSLFVNPFKKVTKGPCKFHLLQGACSSPVVCRAPLFLPCSLQGYRLRCLCPGPYRAPACRRGVFETCPTKAERRLCEGLGPPEHHDAPIPSERVCKSACGASCCTASGTRTPSSLTSGDMNAARRTFYTISASQSARAS